MMFPWLMRKAFEAPDLLGQAKRFNEAVTLDGHGVVALTHPSELENFEALSVGAALDAALHGRTRRFTMIVGYFAHGGVHQQFEADLYDPARLILRELKDREDHPSDDELGARFRLLFGELRSVGSRFALLRWWAICRWHRDQPEEAEAWRKTVLDELRDATLAPRPESALRGIARRVGDKRDRLSPFYQSRAEDPVAIESPTATVSNDAGVLLLFLIHRAAEVRSGRGVASEHRIFHPKLYVVERAANASLGVDVDDVVVIAGSANWSVAALHGGSDANVELATIHRASLRGSAESSPRPLGALLADTADRLFERATVLASWCKPSDVAADPFPALQVELGRCVDLIGGPVPPDEPLDEPRKLPADIARLAAVIAADIELALGIDQREIQALGDTVKTLGREVWGDDPSVYQVDGALRLISLLRRSRGALLTDEPGLGKTLVAEIVAALLIVEAIRRRVTLAGAAALARVRVSILAPARVLGREGREGATQWHAHAMKIRRAVKELLKQEAALAPWASDERLEIRPISNQSLSRRVYQRNPSGPAPQLAREVVEDLQHLAESEVVVLDEAHNFRNGNGAATRVLRFCLSMPVPGEDGWRRDVRPIATPLQPALDLEAEPVVETAAGGRRILLLTATPFNNRIDDVRTQLGHFAKAMDWSETALPEPVREAWQRRVADGGAAVDDPYWQESADSVAPSSTRDFQVLVGAAAEHFTSSRALDDDDAKELSRVAAASGKRQPPSDRGPRYVWAQQHRQLGAIFSAISSVLAKAPDAAVAERAELRNRIDAMLVSHVVQRSRRQVLSMVKAVDAAEPARMFRAPEQPRVPVAVTSDAARVSRDTFEAEVLYRLFELVITGGAATDKGVGDARLTMHAYTIRYERGLRGQGGDAEHRGATNFIGFQAIGLVKRLQSSPYAFLMTLVRGLLRTCAYELALTAEMLDLLRRSSGDRPAKDARPLLPLEQLAGGLDAQVAAASHRLEMVNDAVAERLLSDDGQILLRLMEVPIGEFRKADPRTRLWLLAGLGDPGKPDLECAREQLVLRQKLRGHGETLGEAAEGSELLRGSVRPKNRRRAAAPAPDAASASWARRLLADIAQPVETLGDKGLRWSAGVLGDFFLALDWLVGRPGDLDSTPLVKHLFKNLRFDLADTTATMESVAARFAQGFDARNWLLHTLKSDARAADLIAWLLAQTLLRVSLQGGATADERAAALPAGIKSLVFSEYADTLAYLRAVTIALRNAVEVPKQVGQANRVRTELLKSLCDLTRKVVKNMAGVARALDAGLPNPISPEALDRILPVDDEPESMRRIEEAARALCDATATLTSRTPSGLRLTEVPLASEMAGQDGEDLLGGDGDGPDAPQGVVASSALDAFSPWYQVAPRGGEIGDGTWDRLCRAHEKPVHALMATEVLAEGVNLQECGVVIHYDLPWNPTRLIQRNGRVDRRITPRYEDPALRRAEACGLVDEALHAEACALADAFWPPQNVYHLTVPPIEPDLSADVRSQYARKVREILFTKLSGIREVFGLAAWPIVLEQGEAKRVLDGTLAYETQAFRRREDLFAAHATVARLAASAPECAPSASGCLRLEVSPGLFGRIHRVLAGLPELSDSTLPTDRLRALALLSWSTALPNRFPVRSQVDYRPLAHALSGEEAYVDHFRAHFGVEPDHAGFLNLVAWVDDPGRADPAMVGWLEGCATGVKLRFIAPRLLRAEAERVDWASADRFSWRLLDGAGGAVDGGEIEAPTAAFEAALIGLARALEPAADGTVGADVLGVKEVADDLPGDDSVVGLWRARAGYWHRACGRTLEEQDWPQELPDAPRPASPRTNLFIVAASPARAAARKAT
jgi:hypothetical protein